MGDNELVYYFGVAADLTQVVLVLGIVVTRRGKGIMQLPMFVDPSEIVELTILGEWDSADSVDSEYGWRIKLEHALNYGGHHGHDFYGIESWDVFVPVTLQIVGNRIYVGNGHHRIAVSEYAGMPLIPVIWDNVTFHAGYPSKYGTPDIEHDFR